jgi:hypothetical protein
MVYCNATVQRGTVAETKPNNVDYTNKPRTAAERKQQQFPAPAESTYLTASNGIILLLLAVAAYQYGHMVLEYVK